MDTKMRDKPIWFEGMLLRPQHFQQQEHYLFDFFQSLLESVTRYRWGLRHIEYDEGKLGHGELAITKCEGILPDGTPFTLTDPEELPGSIQLAPGSRDIRIFLGLPNNERIGGANLIDVPTATPDQTLHPTVEPPASAQLRSLVEVKAPFYLVANVSADDQRDFMNQCIIAEAHSLEELLAAGKRGIALEPITRWPNGVPSDKGFSCFRLARAPYFEVDIDKRAENDAHWDAIASSEVGIGFHVRIDLPALTLSLWVARKPQRAS